jgi:hypothetical protein
MLTRKDNQANSGSAVRNDAARPASDVGRQREESVASTGERLPSAGWSLSGLAAVLGAIVSAADAAIGLTSASGRATPARTPPRSGSAVGSPS